MNYSSETISEAERVRELFYEDFFIDESAKCAIITLTELYNSVNNQNDGHQQMHEFYQDQINYLKEKYL